jgi:hypothetical protein
MELMTDSEERQIEQMFENLRRPLEQKRLTQPQRVVNTLFLLAFLWCCVLFARYVIGLIEWIAQ